MKLVKSQFNKVHLYDDENLLIDIYQGITFRPITKGKKYELKKYGKYFEDVFSPLNQASIKLEVI